MNKSIRYCQLLLTLLKHKPLNLVCESSQIFHNKRLYSKSIVSQYGNNTRKYPFRILAAISFVQIFQFLGLTSEENYETKKLIAQAKEVLQKGNEKEALALYNKALIMAVNSQDIEDIYYIKKKIAVIAFNSTQYLEAEKLFLEVQDYLSKKGVPNDDLQMLYIILRLAEINDNLKNYEKAEQYYKTCAKSIKSKISKDADAELIEFWLLFLTSRAHYYLNRGNYEKASKYFAKAYESCSQTKGEMNEQTVILLQQLGSVCYQKGDLDKAIVYLRKATDLGKHLPGLVQLSNAYVSLGNILLKQGLIEEAKLLCDQGLKNAIRHKYEEGIKESNACLEEIQEATS